MDKFFINPIWEISVYRKIAGLIFNPKTNMQDRVRGWSCFGSLLPMPFKQRWKKTCWFLHSPADLAPTVMRHTSSLGQLAKTPYIIHDSSIQHTHTYIFTTRRNISTGWKWWWYQRVVQTWLIIPIVRRKLDFSLVPFILHEHHLETNLLMSFSQSLWSKADHHTITLSLYSLL